MDITRLPHGQKAPFDADCVSIDQTPSGGFLLTGSVLNRELESVSIIDADRTYDTVEEAEAAGLAWLSEYGAAKVYVSYDA